MSYSQHGEQDVLLEIFKGKTDGKILEIGAFDGCAFSNTLALIELGWSGVLVEPSPTAFIALRAKHGNNPKISLVNAAVGFDGHLVKFFDSPDAVGTTEESNRDKWKEKAPFTEHWILPVSITQLTNHFSEEWDLVSIDTEGTSTDIFLAMLSLGFSPKVYVVEHDGRSVEISNAARDKGYRPVYMDGNNVILTK